MSGLFSGYHYLGDESPQPPAYGADQTAGTLPAAPVTDHQQITAEQRQVLLETLEQQLTMERTKTGQFATLLQSLARDLCPQALDDERRQIGDGKLAAWPPEKWLAFIRDRVKSQATPAVPGDDDLSRQYGLLVQDLAELKGENAQLQSEHARLKELIAARAQEMASLGHVARIDRLPQKLAPADAELVMSPVPISASMAAVPAPPSVPALPPAVTPASGDAATTVGESRPPVEQRPAPKADPARVDELVRLIAATGLARLSRIREKLAAMWGVEPRSGSIQNVANTALGQGLIQVFEARIGDWQGAKPKFLELTPTGMTRAREMDVMPVVNELAPGLKRGLTIEMVNLILRAADILGEVGYQRVTVFPEQIALADGLTYPPAISAVAPDGSRLYVECEREKVSADRSARWRLAARAGAGQVWLVTTNAQMQKALVSEINLARADHPFRLAVCNVADYGNGKRGRDGDIWLYRNS